MDMEGDLVGDPRVVDGSCYHCGNPYSREVGVLAGRRHDRNRSRLGSRLAGRTVSAAPGQFFHVMIRQMARECPFGPVRFERWVQRRDSRLSTYNSQLVDAVGATLS